MLTSRYYLLLIIVSIFPALAGAQESTKNIGLIGKNYELKPMDILRVTVYMEPDLEQEIRLSQDGTANLSLIGNTNLGGMSIKQANNHITDLYNRDYLVNPQISLELMSYTEQRVYVHGQVNTPGPVVIPPEENMTLSQVISAAGSMTRLASDKIQLTRTDADGKKTVTIHYFDDILEDPASNDIIIKNGDSIFVSERWI
ncbi:polysaccharide biosynthesis/export family protein [Cerasicoccus fimbriatus]|uniref:polysaccharide biosynthesis/export family protein n=1 Tax=Cerasicoccus fimbriatus TaxID=3014554 RepID=UPI0022B36714|nr:polysaccharide biosynthesis/export family protein [Cerasicoccus sp. TK19100]